MAAHGGRRAQDRRGVAYDLRQVGEPRLHEGAGLATLLRVFPIQDSIPSRHPPLASVALIAVNVLIFWFELSLPEESQVALFRDYGLVPALWHDDTGLRQPAGIALLSPLTSMFLHGGWYHVLGNMWMLWIFGDNVEDRMGTWRFLGFYLLTGVVAGATHVGFHPGSAVPTVGASGAVAGVMGAYVLMFPRARILTFIPILFLPWLIEVSALFFIGIWFVGQVFSATSWVMLRPDQVAGIAFWAHIGGFLAGLALARFFCSSDRCPRRLQADEWSRLDAWKRTR
jgi:membrane associated rhomboid family serine protease